MRFENWALLDLRRRSTGFGPYDGERIVLHMVPKNGSRSERYVVGKFFTERGQSWFEGETGTLSPARLKKFYDFWWVRLPINENLPPPRQ